MYVAILCLLCCVHVYMPLGSFWLSWIRLATLLWDWPRDDVIMLTHVIVPHYGQHTLLTPVSVEPLRVYRLFKPVAGAWLSVSLHTPAIGTLQPAALVCSIFGTSKFATFQGCCFCFPLPPFYNIKYICCWVFKYYTQMAVSKKSFFYPITYSHS